LQRFAEQDASSPAVALALTQARNGNLDQAISTLEMARTLPDAPKSLPVFIAQLWAEKHEWKRAWLAISPSLPRS